MCNSCWKHTSGWRTTMQLYPLRISIERRTDSFMWPPLIGQKQTSKKGAWKNRLRHKMCIYTKDWLFFTTWILMETEQVSDTDFNPAVVELVVWKLVGNITREKYKWRHKEVGIEMVNTILVKLEGTWRNDPWPFTVASLTATRPVRWCLKLWALRYSSFQCPRYLDYLFFFMTYYKQNSKVTFLRWALLLLNQVICCTKYKMRAKEIKEFWWMNEFKQLM